MQDIRSPEHGTEIETDRDGKVLWVNVDGQCVLRISANTKPIVVNGELIVGEQ